MDQNVLDRRVSNIAEISLNTLDGKVLISGYIYPNYSIAQNHIFLIKLETDGDTIWTRQFTCRGRRQSYCHITCWKHRMRII